MSFWSSVYWFAFLAGAVSTLLDTPIFIWLARKLNFMDVPQSNHKGHGKSTPLLGGAAIFSGWFVCIFGAVALALGGDLSGLSDEIAGHLPGIEASLPQLGFLVLGAFLAVVLGLIDDKYALSAGCKFGGQFLIALIAVAWGGVRVNIFFSNSILIWAVSIFWIMLLMNSINFFDNMDGLAVGTVTIAMGFFTIIAALNGQIFIALLSAVTCGAGLGFWFYNTTPAVIFMGDSGSHFLGYAAAVVAAKVTWFGIDFSLSRFPILMPLFILALPLFDTGMVVLIRTLHGKPFWIGDHNHISHRFVRMGLSRRHAVLLVHLMALCIGLGILPVFWGDFRTAAILVTQAFLFLLIISIMQFAISDRRDTRERSQEETKEDKK
ncbi:MAG: undecaprenyl/decaprenyl-phosphate alpha-N-acetylglucosaminyl 1-phosphate transferase [Victivallales bacterium]|nr:undecaprenyl/decaprenyl-phosphate alpha-N-acetylglucosaminyl 1-phosphate transferase [Victivallales bacterium]